MQSKHIISLVIVVTVVLMAGVWFGFRDSGNAREVSRRQGSVGQAPEFALENYDGDVVKLSDFRGKPAVINSWAVWCPFCVKELSDFATVQREFGDRVVIIPIDRAESRKVTKEFTDGLGISNDLVFLLDSSDTFYQAIGGFSMPETLFVDKDGNIIEHKRGPMEIQEIRERVQKIL